MSAEFDTNADFLPSIVEEQGVKLSFQPSKRKKTKKISILIEGMFTLQNAGFVKEKISLSLHAYDFIDITLKNIEQIDLAAIQVAHLLKTNAALSNKHISLDAELSKEDRSLLFNAGLMALLTKTKLTD
ncbi:hypothetical protein CNR22_18920 [Sphingobacteriaceae bacterium]|nr:hypothetical protein CNR22_18920 [Sphingobacteriaceae bacterium]